MGPEVFWLNNPGTGILLSTAAVHHRAIGMLDNAALVVMKLAVLARCTTTRAALPSTPMAWQ
jgi:hypothetical protein